LRVEYRDDVLRRLADDAHYAPEAWRREEIESYRKRLQLILAAKDERDLYAVRVMHPDQRGSDRRSRSTSRLSSGLRLLLTFKSDGDDNTAILELERLP
jgi:proteic killer suppression protein